MSLQRFKIISPKDGHSDEYIFETMLLNTIHIISLKPVQLVIEEKKIIGYWIRTSSGKKYRAVEIPESLKDMLGKDAA